MRRRRKKVFLWLVPAVLIVAGTAYVLLSPSFQIDEITIAGNNTVADDEIERLLPFSSGDHILFIRGSDVKKILGSDERIAWVEIHRRLPNHVDIVIEEMTPVLLLSAGKIWGVSGTGRILPIESPYEIPNLPFLSGMGEELSIEPYRIIESAQLKRGIEFWRDIMEISPQSLDKISEIVVESDDNIRLILTGDGLIAEIGSGDYGQKIMRLEAVLKDISKTRVTVECIDLRYTDQAVVRLDKGARTQPTG